MATAHVCKGNILRAEGRSDRAARSYAEAIALREKYPEAHTDSAPTVSNRSLEDEALEHYQTALEEIPGWGIAHRSVANLLPANGRCDEALLHYTELMARLLADGDLTVSRQLDQVVTYHDPCYLARYNGETEAPREVMKTLGLDLREMPRCGANTFCCGAGGGRLWMDTSNEQRRTSEQRIEEALGVSGVQWFVTTCPKDYTMYTDAVKSLGKEDVIQVRDLIELVAEAVGG